MTFQQGQFHSFLDFFYVFTFFGRLNETIWLFPALKLISFFQLNQYITLPSSISKVRFKFWNQLNSLPQITSAITFRAESNRSKDEALQITSSGRSYKCKLRQGHKTAIAMRYFNVVKTILSISNFVELISEKIIFTFSEWKNSESAVLFFEDWRQSNGII